MDGSYTKYKNSKKGSTTVGKTVGKRGRPRKDDENPETWEYLEHPDGSTVSASEYAIARGWACDFLDICHTFKIALPDSWKHCDVRIKTLFYTGLRTLLPPTQLSQNNAKGRILMNSVYYDHVVRPRLKAAKKAHKGDHKTVALEQARYTIEDDPHGAHTLGTALDNVEPASRCAATASAATNTKKAPPSVTAADMTHDDDDNDNANNDDDDHDHMVEDDDDDGGAGNGGSSVSGDSGDEDGPPLRVTKNAKRKRAEATPSAITFKRPRIDATTTSSPTLPYSPAALITTPSPSGLSAVAKGKQRALGDAVSQHFIHAFMLAQCSLDERQLVCRQ